MANRKISTFERLQRGKLSRKQCKELGRRLQSPNPGLEIIHRNAAGIDVGSGSHFVAVPPDRDVQAIREFGSWTAALHELTAWLKSCAIDTVVVQATGVYWVVLSDVLEGAGLKVWVVNAQGTKNLPGRKSDVQECEWLRKLHTYGLLRAIVGGERDPWKLAQLRQPGVRASEAEIAENLRGTWREELLFELRQVVAHYDFLGKQVVELDQLLEKRMAAMPSREVATKGSPVAEKEEVPEGKRRGRKPKTKVKPPPKNAPAFDIGRELTRLLGVDLRTIDGVNIHIAQTVYTEVGPDLSAFPTEGNFTSWLGLTPMRSVSGGKVIKHEKKRVKNRLADALRMGASTLERSQSYLGARFRYLKARLDGRRAVKAMARYLACLIYRLMTKGQAWIDRGEAYFEQKKAERELRTLQNRAQKMGLQLFPLATVNA